MKRSGLTIGFAPALPAAAAETGTLTATPHSTVKANAPDIVFQRTDCLPGNILIKDPFLVRVPAPEPATMALLGLGLFVLRAARRCRGGHSQRRSS